MHTTALPLLLVAVLSGAFAQDTRPQQRIQTATRLVSEFSGLETQLLRTLQQHNSAALGKVLSEDFAVWTPAPPGAPTPREDWTAEALATNLQSFRVRQMAVQMVGQAAVVNFVLDCKSQANGKDTSGQFFVVDIWNPVGTQWQLATRYLSKVSSQPQTSDLKPSGKR